MTLQVGAPITLILSFELLTFEPEHEVRIQEVDGSRACLVEWQSCPVRRTFDVETSATVFRVCVRNGRDAASIVRLHLRIASNIPTERIDALRYAFDRGLSTREEFRNGVLSFVKEYDVVNPEFDFFGPFDMEQYDEEMRIMRETVHGLVRSFMDADLTGLNALMRAALHGRANVVRVLLRYGANPFLQSKTQQLALGYAIECPSPSTVWECTFGGR